MTPERRQHLLLLADALMQRIEMRGDDDDGEPLTIGWNPYLPFGVDDDPVCAVQAVLGLKPDPCPHCGKTLNDSFEERWEYAKALWHDLPAFMRDEWVKMRAFSLEIETLGEEWGVDVRERLKQLGP